MKDLRDVADKEIIEEVARRFEEKNASMREMEFLTKKLLELNEKTQESEKIKTQFLSLVKNEFNNPISTLLNISNSLVNKKHRERYDEMIKIVDLELLKLDFYFKNIVAATEIEAGEIGNYYSIINFENILDDVFKSLKYLIEEKNLNVNFKNSSKDKIVSDSEKIYLIMLNLISNACEYSYSNSKVYIRLKDDREFFYIEVEDYGEGISLKYHKEIFNRFTKFNTGKTRAQCGLGLGLSVARAEIEALEGEIDFKTKDGNTLFIVKVPKIDEKLIESDNSFSSNELFFDFDESENEKEF